jgi:hypothetical protein
MAFILLRMLLCRITSCKIMPSGATSVLLVGALLRSQLGTRQVCWGLCPPCPYLNVPFISLRHPPQQHTSTDREIRSTCKPLLVNPPFTCRVGA